MRGNPDKEYKYGYFVEEAQQWIFANCRFGSTPDEQVWLQFEDGLHIVVAFVFFGVAVARNCTSVLSVTGRANCAAILLRQCRTVQNVVNYGLN